MLTVIVTTVIDPQVVFMDPNVFHWGQATIARSNFESKAAPNDFTSIRVILRKFAMRVHPLRLILIDTCCSLKNLARLGVEPRLPEYIPGALPTELPSLGKSMGWLLFCHFEFVNRLHIQQYSYPNTWHGVERHLSYHPAFVKEGMAICGRRRHKHRLEEVPLRRR